MPLKLAESYLSESSLRDKGLFIHEVDDPDFGDYIKEIVVSGRSIATEEGVEFFKVNVFQNKLVRRLLDTIFESAVLVLYDTMGADPDQLAYAAIKETVDKPALMLYWWSSHSTAIYWVGSELQPREVSEVGWFRVSIDPKIGTREEIRADDKGFLVIARGRIPVTVPAGYFFAVGILHPDLVPRDDHKFHFPERLMGALKSLEDLRLKTNFSTVEGMFRG